MAASGATGIALTGAATGTIGEPTRRRAMRTGSSRRRPFAYVWRGACPEKRRPRPSDEKRLVSFEDRLDEESKAVPETIPDNPPELSDIPTGGQTCV